MTLPWELSRNVCEAGSKLGIVAKNFGQQVSAMSAWGGRRGDRSDRGLSCAGRLAGSSTFGITEHRQILSVSRLRHAVSHCRAQTQACLQSWLSLKCQVPALCLQNPFLEQGFSLFFLQISFSFPVARTTLLVSVLSLDVPGEQC